MKQWIFVLAFLFTASAAQAQAEPIDVQTVAEKEESYVDENGDARTRLVPAASVVPGDQVIYTVTFENRGVDPVTGVTVTDPVPAQMRYVEGSAFGPGTDITFSADGGNSYAPAGELTVVDADGYSRPARAEEFTHIRWAFRGVLEPGARGFARFKAVLD